MKMVVSSLIGVVFMMTASWVMAQVGDSEIMNGEGHGYGHGMMGYMSGWWVVYCIIKATVVVIVLWLLLRIARAVEKIAVAKS